MKTINTKCEIMTTTVWDFPLQSYGETKKGDNHFNGVTPAGAIYNLIIRYSRPGDIIVDCMAGSGTTLDVAMEERRHAIGFDIAPTRADIIEADARKLPLPSSSVDLHIIDPPYSDNVNYSDKKACLGKLSATDKKYYREMEKVVKELYRTLKPGKYLGWFIADEYKQGKFTPVGFNIYNLLRRYFEIRDIVVVVYRNKRSDKPVWHHLAKLRNFYLRGYRYLFICRKRRRENLVEKIRRLVGWQYCFQYLYFNITPFDFSF